MGLRPALRLRLSPVPLPLCTVVCLQYQHGGRAGGGAGPSGGAWCGSHSTEPCQPRPRLLSARCRLKLGLPGGGCILALQTATPIMAGHLCLETLTVFLQTGGLFAVTALQVRLLYSRFEGFRIAFRDGSHRPLTFLIEFLQIGAVIAMTTIAVLLHSETVTVEFKTFALLTVASGGGGGGGGGGSAIEL